MNKGILAAAAAFSAALLPASGLATTVASPLAGTTTGLVQNLVQDTAIFCGRYGCGPVWAGPRYREWGPGPWGYVYRPACPIDYYYACQRGPLGYGQCACWPYRKW
jgi:hypothetical protein